MVTSGWGHDRHFRCDGTWSAHPLTAAVTAGIAAVLCRAKRRPTSSDAPLAAGSRPSPLLLVKKKEPQARSDAGLHQGMHKERTSPVHTLTLPARGLQAADT
jgi:hypothetical protein